MTSMTLRTEYSTRTQKTSTLFSVQYLRNHWTLDICVLGYIGIVWPKEHSPEVRSFPPGTPCIMSVCELHVGYSYSGSSSRKQSVVTKQSTGRPTLRVGRHCRVAHLRKKKTFTNFSNSLFKYSAKLRFHSILLWLQVSPPSCLSCDWFISSSNATFPRQLFLSNFQYLVATLKSSSSCLSLFPRRLSPSTFHRSFNNVF